MCLISTRWGIFLAVGECFFIGSLQALKVDDLENKHVLTIIRLPLVCGPLRHILNSQRKMFNS